MKFMGYHRQNGAVGVRNHVLIFPTVTCAASVAEKIGRIRRLVTLNKVVYFYENYMPVEMARHLTKKELAEKRSIQKILKKRAGLKVTRGEMYLQAMPAERDIAELLDCQPFEPLVHVQTYFWSAPEKPFEVVNRYLRACNFKYKVAVEIK